MDNVPDAPADTKVCPFCAETIKAAAIVCRYCGRDLEQLPPTPQTPLQTTQGDLPPRYSELPPQPAVSSKFAPPVYEKKPSKLGGCLKIVGVTILVILGLAFLNAFVRGFTSGATATRSTQSAPVGATATPTLTAAQLQAKATVVPFDELARNTEQHEGKLLSVTGDIVQVIEDGSGAGLRLNVDGSYDQTVYVQYPGYDTKRVLDGDTVKMVAQVDGRITYETVLGNKVTIPALTALWLEVVPE